MPLPVQNIGKLKNHGLREITSCLIDYIGRICQGEPSSAGMNTARLFSRRLIVAGRPMTHHAAAVDGGGEGLDHFGNGIHGIPTHDTAAPTSRTSCRLRLGDFLKSPGFPQPKSKTAWDICVRRLSQDARPTHLFPCLQEHYSIVKVQFTVILL